MKEIYILSAVGKTASVMGAIPFFNSSSEQSNQTALSNPAENHAKLRTNTNDRETNNVSGSNETEQIIDPQLASQAKIAADEAQSIAMTNKSAQSSDVRSVELEDENGQLVYEVEIKKTAQSLDVKVDAIAVRSHT
jgi:uncharacterized membrane protein YkoI